MDNEMLEKMIADLSVLERDREMAIKRNIAERLEKSLGTYEREICESAHWEEKRVRRKVSGKVK